MKPTQNNDKMLKTLRDITRHPTITSKENGRLIIEKELKAEAIKWVKNCPTIYSSYRCSLAMLHSKCDGCKRMADFFNITEEDLNDTKD